MCFNAAPTWQLLGNVCCVVCVCVRVLIWKHAVTCTTNVPNVDHIKPSVQLKRGDLADCMSESQKEDQQGDMHISVWDAYAF